MRTLWKAVVGSLVGALLVGGTAHARVAYNTIDPVAMIEKGERGLIVGGPIACSVGERVHVLVTVTQRTTGAIAEGRGILMCTGDVMLWAVEAEAQNDERFTQGESTAVAVAWTVRRGVTTDAHQWLVPITLIAE
jgi:hypothetical protein